MKNKAGTIGIIITIIVLIIVVAISNISTGKLAVIEGTVNKIFMPIQNGIVFIKNKITGNEQELSDINSLKSENQKIPLLAVFLSEGSFTRGFFDELRFRK